MLNRLQKIKRHREHSLRRAMTHLIHEEQNLLSDQITLRERLNLLFQKWREQADQSGYLDHSGLTALRSALARTERDVQQLKHELNSLASELIRLAQQRKELEESLSRNLREQEKLLLLEELQ